MICSRQAFFILLFILCSIGSIDLLGQANKSLDADWPYPPPRTERLSQVRAGIIDTLFIGPNQPFFDDFSYDGPLPDTNKWYLSENNFDAPYINQRKAINPPTTGVATFDGIDRFNRPYNTTALSVGLTDQLASHYIDLSPYDASDKIKLSFYLQPQGLGDRPEETDSFFVWFLVPGLDKQFRVYAQSGTALRNFRQIVIPVDQDDYFHTTFQLVFESQASQNGSLDLWHLDYVYMAFDRNMNDTLYQDQSAVMLNQSPLAPYTAIPLQHYQPGSGNFNGIEGIFSNLSGSSQTKTLKAGLSDPVGSTTFNGFFQDQFPQNLSPTNRTTVNFSAFDDQVFEQIGAFELSLSLPGNNDDFSGNDEVKEIYRIDSIFAYDDGVSDQGFGLNKAWGFGNQWHIAEEDTLVAVWICFNPTIFYNTISTQVVYLEDQSFRLAVWFDDHPDSLLVQQSSGARVNYGMEPDYFHRYPLTNPVAVSDTFWVGLQQVNTNPIGVGLDQNYNNHTLTYWDSSGTWVSADSSLNGTLMIRPEMKRSGPAQPLRIAEESKGFFNSIGLYPNPVTEGKFWIDLDGIKAGYSYQGTLIDMNGRRLYQIEHQTANGNRSVQIPHHLSAGLYFWEHQLIDPNGQSHRQIEKIIIHF